MCDNRKLQQGQARAAPPRGPSPARRPAPRTIAARPRRRRSWCSKRWRARAGASSPMSRSRRAYAAQGVEPQETSHAAPRHLCPHACPHLRPRPSAPFRGAGVRRRVRRRVHLGRRGGATLVRGIAAPTPPRPADGRASSAPRSRVRGPVPTQEPLAGGGRVHDGAAGPGQRRRQGRRRDHRRLRHAQHRRVARRKRAPEPRGTAGLRPSPSPAHQCGPVSTQHQLLVRPQPHHGSRDRGARCGHATLSIRVSLPSLGTTRRRSAPHLCIPRQAMRPSRASAFSPSAIFGRATSSATGATKTPSQTPNAWAIADAAPHDAPAIIERPLVPEGVTNRTHTCCM